MSKYSKKSVTLIELLVACVILLVFLIAFFQSFTGLLKTSEYSQAMSYAQVEARNKLSELIAYNFATLRQDYDPTNSPTGVRFNPLPSFPPGSGITASGNIKFIDRSDLIGSGSLSDGVHWVQATPGANWPKTAYHASIVYPQTGINRKMWLMDGNNGGIWWSVDGANWTIGTNAGTNSWINVRARASMVIFPFAGTDRMWIIGGNGGKTLPCPGCIEDPPGGGWYSCWDDIWYSSDENGVNWSVASDSLFWLKQTWGHTSIVYPSTGAMKMWIMGGISTPSDVFWSSDPNGVIWQKETMNPAWKGRTGHTSVVFPASGAASRMWVMGGMTGFLTYSNDVWWSSDINGIVWDQATSNAAWPGRYLATSIVYDNKIWIMGGQNNSGKLNDVWWSTDGISWNCAAMNVEWPARHLHTSLSYDNKMWIMGGEDNTNTRLNDVWYTAGTAAGDRLIEVLITICWRTRDGRIFGEDGSDGSMPDGILQPSEDKNSNSEMDSPVQIRTFLSDKNLPLKKVYLGRPE